MYGMQIDKSVSEKHVSHNILCLLGVFLKHCTRNNKDVYMLLQRLGQMLVDRCFSE